MTRMSRWLAHGTMAIALGIALAGRIGAQQPQSPQLVTRTFTLRYLRSADAARLVAPYVRVPNGGVYEAGAAVQAVTVIETAPTLARIDSLLRENDRAPTVIVLRFQLIGADDNDARDPAVDSIETTLRSLFRYRGYHLLGQGTTTAGEGEDFSLTMAGGEDRYALAGEIVTVQPSGGPIIIVDGVRQAPERGDQGSVRVRVRLGRMAIGTTQGKPNEAESLLSTGLSVPIGQTVVLGSAAPGGRGQAIILTIRPEVAIPAGR